MKPYIELILAIGDQVYEVAFPTAFKVTLLFRQTVGVPGEIEKTGKGFTVIVVVFIAELHPKLPPKTENTELILGLATATWPVLYVVMPGVLAPHVYEVAPWLV